MVSLGIYTAHIHADYLFGAEINTELAALAFIPVKKDLKSSCHNNLRILKLTLNLFVQISLSHVHTYRKKPNSLIFELGNEA